MMWTIIEKEIRVVLTSPKFVTTFAVCSLLILLSIALGVREYAAFEAQQAAAQSLVQHELGEAEQWSELRPKAFRPVDPLQIFVSGVHADVGRFSLISASDDIKLRRGVYEDDPALAVFRAVDLAFIVTVVLSLFAILFTFDAVSGERESGTLRLVLSNPVPRVRLILGKFLGTWLGLAVPLALPTLLGVLWVILAGVPFSADHWLRLSVLLAAAALYFTFFVALGLAVSVLCRNSNTAFLILLGLWVMIVLIVPRVGLTVATRLRPVPSTAEIAGRNTAFENAQWNSHRTQLAEAWAERSAQMEGLSEDERISFEDEHLWNWLEQDEEVREQVEQRITDNRGMLEQELRNAREEQARLALSLGRPSPATAFRLVAMVLAETDYRLKDRAEEAMRRYRDDFHRFVKAKSGDRAGNRRVVVRRGHGAHFNMSSNNEVPVDLSEMPVFEMPHASSSSVVAAVLPDLGLLAAMAALCFVVAFVGFLRQDLA